MRIAVVGVSFQKTPIGDRERFVGECSQWFPVDCPHVVLSTCNRVEMYYAPKDIMPAVVFPGAYHYHGERCFLHLARVTCGLDSSILGETEIQRQVKEAYENAAIREKLPSSLHFLFQKSLRIGKKLRTRHTFYREQRSLGDMVGEFFSRYIQDKDKKAPFFLGNSAVNRQIIRVMLRSGWKDIVLCTQHPLDIPNERVCTVGYDRLESWKRHKVVIIGTKSERYVLEYRGEKTLRTEYLIDLGVPRNVDPLWQHHVAKGFLNMDDMASIEQHQRIDTTPIEWDIRDRVYEYVERYISKNNYPVIVDKGLHREYFPSP